MCVFAKVFQQIFDSSIAENYEVRHVFEDLLKLADREGAVDMTVEAIARRVNMPVEKVRFGIEELSKPDLESRTKDFEGRRLIPISDGRSWGWFIVNYRKYRDLQDEESRRVAFRDAKRRQRAKGKIKLLRRDPNANKPLAGEQRHVQAINGGGTAVEPEDLVR
jgi:hypothetical protein